MASICCSPPESVPASWVRRSASFGNRRYASASVSFALPRARGSSAPISRFSSTLSVGNTWRPSATWPMPRLQIWCDSSRVISRPLKVMRPARARSMPAMVRMSEDLPAPLAPTMATMLPCGTSSETPASACASP